MRLFITAFMMAANVVLTSQVAFNTALKRKCDAPYEKLDVIVRGNREQIDQLQGVVGHKVLYWSGPLGRLTASYRQLRQLDSLRILTEAYLPEHRWTLLSDTMLVRNRIPSIHAGQLRLLQAYTGRGILLGMIDTGTDFNHNDFKDSTGHTRIRFMWEQYKTGTAPATFSYGTEWTAAQIDAKQCTHTDLPHYGHGTNSSGVAAGNGRASGKFKGVAPNADLIVVALDFNKSGPVIPDAVKYITDRALALGKPCVINASVGDYYGSHDGTDPETAIIEQMVTNLPGRVMVSAAGNAGGIPFHLKTTPKTDTVFTWLYNNTNLVEFDAYGDTAKIHPLVFRVFADRSADLSAAGHSHFIHFSDGLASMQHDTIFNQQHQRLAVLDIASSINSKGVYERYIGIHADTSDMAWRISTTGNGEYQSWNFDFISSGLPTAAQYPDMVHHIRPDSMSTMVSGFQCSNEIITVGNYINLQEYKDVRDSIVHPPGVAGDISGSSSFGPTRDGRIKPDIMATGDYVFSAVPMDLKPYVLQANPERLATDTLHIIGGGTSVSSPVVAGLCALYLERKPTANNRDLLHAITSCAYSDQYTGHQLPNVVWGYGKLDGFAAMTCGEVDDTGIPLLNKNSITAFPVPFHDRTEFHLPAGFNGRVDFFGTDGRWLFAQEVSGPSATIEWRSNYCGLVLARFTGNQTFTTKLIREP